MLRCRPGLGYVWALRRFTVGVGRWGAVTWQPPLPVVVLVAAFVMATMMLWLGMIRRRPARMSI